MHSKMNKIIMFVCVCVWLVLIMLFAFKFYIYNDSNGHKQDFMEKY